MSDSNFRRLQPHTLQYSNNYRSSRASHEPNFHRNPRFSHEENNEMEQESNQNSYSTYHQSPFPLLVPSSEHMEKSNQRQRNDRPFHHIENHLSYRIWSNTANQQYFRRYPQQHFKFHLVCYNILSQALLEDNRFLYVNCLRNNLKWYRRKDRLFRELLRQDADILCLQEMENYHYENDFRPTFMQHGYDSIYLKRTGDKSDGCCIFYKMNRLRLIESKTVPFYQKDIRILDRDNCGLIALFQPIAPNVSSDDIFCVATTHLLFSPKRGDIKLAQIQYFLAEIDRLAIKDPYTNSYYPIILCGDFNAQHQSPLIQFLLDKYIKYDDYRCIEISGQKENSIVNNRFSSQLPSNELLPSSFVTADCRLVSSNNEPILPKCNNRLLSAILTHNKQFQSVYDLNNSLDVTTNAGDVPQFVDYIFYTQQEDDPYRLNLLSRFDLYKQNQMIDIHMPNHQFPSDHFLLAAKFALKLRKINKQ
ncbi:unnamed protein product [Rotaria sp. Silwood1]|nr:unnamed protein product [Rotaria sp. Silwood1]CAF4869763.1 unnamed protein product [Rotaria sp. Silwood1]